MVPERPALRLIVAARSFSIFKYEDELEAVRVSIKFTSLSKLLNFWENTVTTALADSDQGCKSNFFAMASQYLADLALGDGENPLKIVTPCGTLLFL